MLMTCRHVRQLHGEFIDGELSPSLMAEVHAHLLQCPECQRQVEMLRACGTIIRTDRSEPPMPSGFASQVVAMLPKRAPGGGSAVETRRARRQRLWRVAVSASLPAAAAVLFFSILIWPPAETTPRLVAGKAVEASGVEGVVNPTLGAMADTKQAAASLSQLLTIAGDEARRDVEAGLHNVKAPEITPWEELIFGPFTGLLDPPESYSTEDADDKDLVRF
ncbi:MAG: zf-HC2 domain-containing protein [Phycisphaerae bacterium]|nr:zf-HC2 domain-containing protein [Phycisphaerae bacterium]